MIIQMKIEPMKPDTWTIADAKANLSLIIERAQLHGPQTITRHGRAAAVIVAAKQWERKTKRTGNLAEFFAASPLRGSTLNVERIQDRPRNLVPERDRSRPLPRGIAREEA